MRNETPLNIGDRVGHLTIIGPLIWIKRNTHCRVRCVCGNETMPQRSALRDGRTTSCGCMGIKERAQANTRHGHSSRKKRSPEYLAWAGMIQRCNNQNSAAYQWYGARGISVCKRWLDFEKFLSDMGKRPRGLFLERKNNRGGYRPSNCVWATRGAQMRNTRQTKMVSLGGHRMCVVEAAAALGIPPGRIYWRVHKHGVTHQAALDAIVGAGTYTGA